jgi:hypothetical protein
MPLVLVLLLGQGAVVALIFGKAHATVTYSNALHVVVLAVLELFGKVRVSIDEQGLALRYGYVGWLRQRIALGRVRAVRAVRVEPLEHGGWGYRGSLRVLGRVAVVIRSGPALQLDLEQDRRFTVTVDEPETAVLCLTRLLAGRAGNEP